MANKIEKVQNVLENIFSLYKKLCDFSNFTEETSQRKLSLKRNLKISSMQLHTNIAQSEKHFSQSLHTQRELVALIADEANIKAKLMQIQSSITPHLEVLHKEQVYAEIVSKKNPNLSTLDGLLHLATKTAI